MVEFDERVGEAYAAKTADELRLCLRELPTPPAKPESDDVHRQYRLQVRNQAAGWASTNGICIGIWAAGGAGPFWPIWPLIFTTVGLIALLIRGAEAEQERRQREKAKKKRHRRARDGRDAAPRAPLGMGRKLATVLYIDIVDSTRRALELGDARWSEVLDDYEETVRDAVEEEGGRVVKTAGDGALAMFDVPAAALRAALETRHSVSALSLDIRAGIHTGEVEIKDGDVAGVGVHLAERVCASASPAEILASRTVVDLVIGSRVRFTDRGEHDLKGFDEPVRLFALLEQV